MSKAPTLTKQGNNNMHVRAVYDNAIRVFPNQPGCHELNSRLLLTKKFSYGEYTLDPQDLRVDKCKPVIVHHKPVSVDDGSEIDDMEFKGTAVDFTNFFNNKDKAPVPKGVEIFYKKSGGGTTGSPERNRVYATVINRETGVVHYGVAVWRKDLKTEVFDKTALRKTALTRLFFCPKTAELSTRALTTEAERRNPAWLKSKGKKYAERLDASRHARGLAPRGTSGIVVSEYAHAAVVVYEQVLKEFIHDHACKNPDPARNKAYKSRKEDIILQRLGIHRGPLLDLLTTLASSLEPKKPSVAQRSLARTSAKH